MMRMAVVLSGTGRTLANFLQKSHHGQLLAEVALVISDMEGVRGNHIAEEAGVPLQVLPRERYPIWLFNDKVAELVKEYGIDLVCLAGFLRLLVVPSGFTGRVMNIHPSLLPAFGGKGLYGSRVHAAVIDSGVKVSGCTVHFADAMYDHGPIILQKTLPVSHEDTERTLAERVFVLEQEAYPEAVNLFARGRLLIKDHKVVVDVS